MFAKSFVINLPFKTDRLATFLKRSPLSIGPVDVWPAVHGDSIIHPDWWLSGRGAWGCYRSHLQILEHCYQQNVESYVVFEDDAIFRPNFDEQLQSFVAELPDDWEMSYLGGQLLHEGAHPPKLITEHVYIPYNVNRTHCFAVHRRGYEKVYKHLNSVFVEREHIDHHLGRLHETGLLKIYCPGKWLVGQDGGPSNISGNNNAATFWVDPEKLSDSNAEWQTRYIPSVFLESSIEVAVELERRGWHRGHWQNEQRLDRGVCNAIASADLRAGLEWWHKAVMPEAVREGKACVNLFHPTLSWACVDSLGIASFVRIKADNADQAEQLLREHIDAKLVTTQKHVRRNLIYHIWPKQGNDVWQWNVAELLKRIDQFDGVRSIAVATSDDADSLATVQAAFGRERIDNWITFANDPNLGETATFLKLLETLPKNDNSVTFRGHAKGVKYPDPGGMKPWTEMLYEICLDDPEYVQASLDQYPVSGPFVVDNRDFRVDVDRPVGEGRLAVCFVFLLQSRFAMVAEA